VSDPLTTQPWRGQYLAPISVLRQTTENIPLPYGRQRVQGLAYGYMIPLNGIWRTEIWWRSNIGRHASGIPFDLMVSQLPHHVTPSLFCRTREYLPLGTDDIVSSLLTSWFETEPPFAQSETDKCVHHQSDSLQNPKYSDLFQWLWHEALACTYYQIYVLEVKGHLPRPSLKSR
jgi:hypothetical protein